MIDAIIQKLTQEQQQLLLLQEMCRVIAIKAQHTGDFATAIPELSLFRRDNLIPPIPCIVEPSIVLVTQGTKQMWLGGKPYMYDSEHFIITSIDFPADSEVLEASIDKPCLGLLLKLDLKVITDLISQSHLHNQRERNSGLSISIGTTDVAILSPLMRLLTLLDEPQSIPVLAPLIQREIYYRILMSGQANKLFQVLSVDSQCNKIAKAIEWLKLNYTQPLRITELATRVQMSIPTFYQHFRVMTAMSPLQYQKWLRLSEARRLMLNQHLDVSNAAYQVGYESPSQFSREYSRLFGLSPKRDIAAQHAV